MLNHLKDATNITQTENGANAHHTTKSFLLDFFATSGALRGNSGQFVQNFSKAYAEDYVAATKLLFHCRDIRGGQGERENFRQGFKYLIHNDPKVAVAVMSLIPEYGRWDDIFVALGTELENVMLHTIAEQMVQDLENLEAGNISSISLLAKWLPSEKGNGKQRHPLVSTILKTFNLTAKEYRKDLSSLRAAIDLVERKMSAREWDAINFNRVPSQALLKYRTAFYKQTDGRFEEWLDSKESKIQAGTIAPHQIVNKIRMHNYDGALTSIWDNLPNWVSEDDNTLVVVDTSGSMEASRYSQVKPIDVAVGLGLYFAERNKGMFHNHFITFSRQPQLQQVIGKTIVEKVKNLLNAHWDQNTNLEAVFDLVLNTAVKNNLPQSELPSRLVIISDMEFDAATGTGYSWFNSPAERTKGPLVSDIEKKWRGTGYKMPQLVFWNVDAKTSQFPINTDADNKILVSGFNPQIMQTIMSNEEWSPLTMMWEVVNQERYSAIGNAIDTTS